MDVNEIIWDYFQPSTSMPTEPDYLEQRMEDESLPTLPAICPNDLENILNSLSPSADTTRNHIDSRTSLDDTTVYTVDNNDYDMESGFDAFASPGYESQISSSNHQSNNLQSNPVYVNVDQFSSSNSYRKSSLSSDISYVSFPMETNMASYSPLNSTQSSSGAFNDFKGVEPTKQADAKNTYQQYKILKPKYKEFKQILSLNTDASTVKEPWQPKVAKKILSAYYTPLNLKSAFLATQVHVDDFQSMAMREAISAFHGLVIREPAIFKKGEVDLVSCPLMFVQSCKKVRAYKRLLIEDKVTLLTSIFFDSIALESVLTYNQLTDTWNCSGVKVNRRDVFRMDASLHNGIVRIIETFPDRWRGDLTVAALLYLIVIFNPDLPNLKFKDSIKMEQYTYIFLLQRYLEMTCKSPCEASDYHYRMIAKIADIQNLRPQMQYFFQMHIISYSLTGCILKLIGSFVKPQKRKTTAN